MSSLWSLSSRARKASLDPSGSWDPPDFRYVGRSEHDHCSLPFFLDAHGLCEPVCASVSPHGARRFPSDHCPLGCGSLQGPKGDKGSRGNLVSGWARGRAAARGWAKGTLWGRTPAQPSCLTLSSCFCLPAGTARSEGEWAWCEGWGQCGGQHPGVSSL